MTAALEGCEWSAARPGRTLPPGNTWYPFYKRLGGPQGRCGRAENLVPTGIRSRTVHPLAQSLYRLSYPALYMKSYVHVWYLAWFLDWQILQSCRENKKHFMFNSPSPQSIAILWGNVQKHDRAKEQTEDSIIRRMRFACLKTKATDTHSENVMLLFFHGNSGYVKAAQCLRACLECYVDKQVLVENRIQAWQPSHRHFTEVISWHWHNNYLICDVWNV